MGDDSLRVLCGPTAAGKSALALWLADQFPVTILCADSRQIYRGFDIGTAKPTAADQLRAPHRGIDLVAPDVRYSAAAWAVAARGWIAEAQREGRLPLVVCGTGFYVRALVDPLFEEPAMDADRRDRLRAYLAGIDTDALRAWCASLDPERAHLGRVQLLRAVEVALLTGTRLSALHAAAPRAAPLRARYLVLDPGPVLATRIAARVDQMLDAGWMEEVRALEARVAPEAPAWHATGYRLVREAAEGVRTLDDARTRVIIQTRQYAKRQRTWFRHQLAAADVTCIDGRDDVAAQAIVRSWWSGEGVK